VSANGWCFAEVEREATGQTNRGEDHYASHAGMLSQFAIDANGHIKLTGRSLPSLLPF
jgi:hypothetical protein